MDPARIRAILIIIAVVALILFGCFKNRFISHGELLKKLDGFFTGRAPLSDDDFYIQYFEAQGIPKEIPIKVRHIFEKYFDADFSRIRNTDDFPEEMKFIWGFDSMVDMEIAAEISKEFDLPDEVKFEKVRSIQDIVSMIWKYKQTRPNHRVHSITDHGGAE